MKKTKVVATPKDTSDYLGYIKAASLHREHQESYYREAIMQVDAMLEMMVKQFTVAGEYSQLQVIEGMLKNHLNDINKFKTIIAATLIQTDVELDPKAAKQVEAFKQFANKTAQTSPPTQKAR